MGHKYQTSDRQRQLGGQCRRKYGASAQYFRKGGFTPPEDIKWTGLPQGQRPCGTLAMFPKSSSVPTAMISAVWDMDKDLRSLAPQMRSVSAVFPLGRMVYGGVYARSRRGAGPAGPVVRSGGRRRASPTPTGGPPGPPPPGRPHPAPPRRSGRPPPWAGCRGAGG